MLANLFTHNPSYKRISRCIQYWLQGSTPAEIPSELCIESTLGKTIPSRGGLPLRRHLTLKSECRNIELKNFLISSSSYASIQKIGLYISVHSFRDWFLHVSRHLQSPECKINYSVLLVHSLLDVARTVTFCETYKLTFIQTGLQAGQSLNIDGITSKYFINNRSGIKLAVETFLPVYVGWATILVLATCIEKHCWCLIPHSYK